MSSTTTFELANQDERVATPRVLVAYGIALPNGALYRDAEDRRVHPGLRGPTVWRNQRQANIERAAIAAMLTVCGSTEVDAVRVVRLESSTDGVWTLPDPGYRSHRPTDPETGQPSVWPCASTAEPSVSEARQAMREHRTCAGPLPCRVRSRARAALARAGVMQLPSAERAARLWPSLTLPETAR